MTREEIKKRLDSLLENRYRLTLDAIDPDVPIMEQMPVDSALLINIMVDVEKEFGIEVPLTLIETPTLNNFLSIVGEEVAKKEKRAG